MVFLEAVNRKIIITSLSCGKEQSGGISIEYFETSKAPFCANDKTNLLIFRCCSGDKNFFINV